MYIDIFDSKEENDFYENCWYATPHLTEKTRFSWKNISEVCCNIYRIAQIWRYIFYFIWSIKKKNVGETRLQNERTAFTQFFLWKTGCVFPRWRSQVTGKTHTFER